MDTLAPLLVVALVVAVLTLAVWLYHRVTGRWPWRFVGGAGAALGAVLVGWLAVRRRRPPTSRDNGGSRPQSSGVAKVGGVAQDILLQRHAEAQDAIEAAATDPGVGPTLADLLNADAARRR